MERKDEHIHILADRRLVEEIDDFGFSNRIRTRAEAIRRLIRAGLVAKSENEKGTEAAA